MPESFDVIVVGGGPAGCAAATTLALRGRRVVLLEKAPDGDRYRVGESLIPYCWFTLDRIGALDAIRSAGFQTKECVQFVSAGGRLAQPYYFADHLDHEAATTWQVPRRAFDRILLDNTRGRGVDVRTGVTARRTLTDDGGHVVGVEAETAGERSELHAPMTVDASGREGLFVARERKWKVQQHALDRVAVWSYFRGAERDPGRDEGATTIARLSTDGWVWLLPMADDRMSVGVVARADRLFGGSTGKVDPEAAFWRSAHDNDWVRRRLASAEPVEPFRVTRNFSYAARHCAADGVVLAGDAFAFLDPVFSPGVFLALASGEQAAWAVDAALAAGRRDAAAFDGYAAWLSTAIEPMRRLIYSFYDRDFSVGRLVRDDPALRGDLTDCLIGNVEHDFRALFAAMAELTRLPEPLPVTPAP